MGNKTVCYVWGCQDRSVPRELLELFSITSFIENPEIVGSFSYPKKHKYPGDVDVFEKVTIEADNWEDVPDVYSNFFSSMARRIIAHNKSASQRKDIFLTDFKAGTYQDIYGKTEKLRWSLEELSNQIAIRNGARYFLRDALEEGTIVKGDFATNYNGRLVSVEFFYHLTYKIENKELFLSSTGDKKYKDSVREDFLKYSDENSPNFKPLKALKRLWILSILDKNANLANKISTIFDSDSAAFHQARETVALTLLLLEKYNICQVPLDQVILNIMSVSKTAFNHGTISVFNTVDIFLDKIWNIYYSRGTIGIRRMIPIVLNLQEFLTELTVEEPASLLKGILSGGEILSDGEILSGG